MDFYCQPGGFSRKEKKKAEKRKTFLQIIYVCGTFKIIYSLSEKCLGAHIYKKKIRAVIDFYCFIVSLDEIWRLKSAILKQCCCHPLK